MPVILPDGHPSIEVLKAEGVSVFSASEAFGRPRIKVALSNTMSNSEETDTQFARALSSSEHFVELISFSPAGRFEKAKILASKYADVDPATLDVAIQKELATAVHRLTFHQPLSAIKDDKYDGIIAAGFGKSKLPLRQATKENPAGVDFYDEFVDVVDYAREANIPMLATCWSAHVILERDYGIKRVVSDTKLTGVFNVQVTAPNDLLMKGLGESFPLPVSRFGTSNDDALQNHAELEVIASSPETGAAIAREKHGNIIFMTGHLEYLAKTLLGEFLRDLRKGLKEFLEKIGENASPLITNALIDLEKNKGELPPDHLEEILQKLQDNGIVVPRPQHYDVHNPQRTWIDANATVYPNLVKIFSVARLPAPIARPASVPYVWSQTSVAELTQ